MRQVEKEKLKENIWRGKNDEISECVQYPEKMHKSYICFAFKPHADFPNSEQLKILTIYQSTIPLDQVFLVFRLILFGAEKRFNNCIIFPLVWSLESSLTTSGEMFVCLAVTAPWATVQCSHRRTGRRISMPIIQLLIINFS